MDIIWQRYIPLKMSLFGWCLLHDRVPTKVNLFKHRIISFGDQLCVLGCGQIESSDHLFLDCTLYGYLWFDVYRWLGIVRVCPNNLTNDLHQFGFFVGISKVHRICMVMIWCACIWIIWKDMNIIIFFRQISLQATTY